MRPAAKQLDDQVPEETAKQLDRVYKNCNNGASTVSNI